MTTRLAVEQSTLGNVFDPRANSLNALRLVLAAGVIVWHSFPLTGADIGFAPLRQLLSNGWVDGFFAVSGYLIVSSWIRRPEWRSFLAARLLRLLPGFYTCLFVTVLVIAPLGLVLAGITQPPGYWADAWGYIVSNGGLRVTQYGIAGTPIAVPYPEVWNGSLWTLWWEFLCYLGVLALGVSSLLRFRWCIPVVFGVCLIGVIVTSYGPVDNFYATALSRFGVMFTAGALIHQFQHRLRVRWLYVAVAALIVVVSSLLPDYRIVAALPLAYLLIAVGALVTNRLFWLRNDISYGIYIYAFPLQQCLAMFGLQALGVPLFAAVSIAVTVPMALASWFLIEKPALRLRKRLSPHPARRGKHLSVSLRAGKQGEPQRQNEGR